MLYIKTLEEGLDVFKALGSDIRVAIVRLLLKNKGMSMNELASHLNITNGALTSHIKKLEDCGIVTIVNEPAVHGNQKTCMVLLDKVLIDFDTEKNNENIYETEIRIGHYTNFQIYPSCGLATSSQLIGEVDDPRYFAHPDRVDADILWFDKGFVEYVIPNFVPAYQKIDQLSIYAELGLRASDTANRYPASLSFVLNDTVIGSWTSPVDFGEPSGIFTPDWWYSSWKQHGVFKNIIINDSGTFLDGVKLSSVSMKDFLLDYKSTIKFRISVNEEAGPTGGLTIFGRNFGNYNQNINIRINYSPI